MGKKRAVMITFLIVIILLSVGVTTGCIALTLNPELTNRLFPVDKIEAVLPNFGDKQSSEVIEANDEKYLSETVFVGDSRTHAMDIYGYADISKTIAEDGLCHSTALTKRFADLGDGYLYTMQEALAIAQPKRVYVGFGINGLGYMAEDDFISDYRTLITQIQDTCPDATIVIMSILPVSERFALSNPKMNNEQIQYHNALLSGLAREMDINYLDISPAVTNENDAMAMEYDSGDGLHLNSKAYEHIFKMILANKVK